MGITLSDFASTDRDYIAKHNANNAALRSAINDLAAKVAAGGGSGADLILQVFDRPGILGTHSYVLDLEAYAGGTTIDIGRRPAPDSGKGETNISSAWGTFGGEQQLVQLSGDVTLDASTITAGLPKTIYVGIPSSGTPQLYESTATPNVIYAYSMTWNGFQLTDFKRMAHILPAYSLFQKLAANPQILQVFDTETDFVSDETGSTQLVIPGAADDNEAGFECAVEILGFFASAGKADDDGFSAPGGVDPETVAVRFNILDENDDVMTAEEFEFDASNIPDSIFKPVDPTLGDKRFAVDIKEFRLVRTHIGENVVSARAFIWGVVYRPIYGLAIPKNTTTVEEV